MYELFGLLLIRPLHWHLRVSFCSHPTAPAPYPASAGDKLVLEMELCCAFPHSTSCTFLLRASKIKQSHGVNTRMQECLCSSPKSKHMSALSGWALGVHQSILLPHPLLCTFDSWEIHSGQKTTVTHSSRPPSKEHNVSIPDMHSTCSHMSCVGLGTLGSLSLLTPSTCLYILYKYIYNTSFKIYFSRNRYFINRLAFVSVKRLSYLYGISTYLRLSDGCKIVPWLWETHTNLACEFTRALVLLSS